MKKFLATVVLFFGAVISAHAQGTKPQLHYADGAFDSRAYATWTAFVFNGPYASGTVAITIAPAYVTLADGYVFSPWSTSVSITVGAGNPSAETVTPSSVSVGPCPAGVPASGMCATVTATFSNAHGQGDPVISGSQGIQDAIFDASNTPGVNTVFWTIDPGIVTLSTGAANTNLGSVSIPTRSVVTSASAKVTTTITSCSGGWSLGWSTGTEFTAANSTLTAGTNTDSSTITLPAAVIAATVPINKCTTSNASAGAIHARFSGYKVVAPAN